MKKDFKDGSFVEIRLGDPGKIALILASRDASNPLKLVVNSIEITIQEFADMVHDLPIELPVAKKENT